LFRPADVEDLASFLKALPARGAGDGAGRRPRTSVVRGRAGIKGVVIRLMRGFTGIAVEGHESSWRAPARPISNVALDGRATMRWPAWNS